MHRTIPDFVKSDEDRAIWKTLDDIDRNRLNHAIPPMKDAGIDLNSACLKDVIRFFETGK